MFLLFNKVYVSQEIELSKNKYPCTVISKKGVDRSQNSSKIDRVAEDLYTLLDKYRYKDIQRWFNELKQYTDKYIIYADESTYELLQMIFYKSIYSSVEASYLVYQTNMEMLKYTGEDESKVLDFDTFKEKYQDLPVINDIPKDQLGIEYLIPYYFKDGHYLQSVVYQRISEIALLKLLRSYIDNKNAILKIGYLVTEEDVLPGQLEKAFKELNLYDLLTNKYLRMDEVRKCLLYFEGSDLLPITDYVRKARNETTHVSDIYIINQLFNRDPNFFLLDINRGMRGYLINAYSDNRINTYLLGYFYKLIINKNFDKLNEFLFREDHV